MTSPEHTLVGIHLALALGCHRYFGWVAVAIAGIASNLPDWDGLPMLVDMQRFESGHRVWGHNFLAILLASFVLAFTQKRFRWIEGLGRLASRNLPIEGVEGIPISETNAPRSISGLAVLVVAFFAQLVHLPCDMVVSGGKGLSDWPIQPFWPFSDAGFVYPLIPWGDVGPTVILMAGIILVAKYSKRTSAISATTLVVVVVYLFVRGWI